MKQWIINPIKPEMAVLMLAQALERVELAEAAAADLRAAVKRLRTIAPVAVRSVMGEEETAW